jgi:hypothetical protein
MPDGLAVLPMPDGLAVLPMPDGLAVLPEVTGTAALRKASSACHGAKLNPGQAPGSFTCRECGNPTERVLGDPEEVSFHG